MGVSLLRTTYLYKMEDFMNTFTLNTYQDSLVDFTRDIYFNQDKLWVVTNN